jgi:putative endonuclease
MDHDYYVYILTGKGRATLYIGVTNDLQMRLWQHRNPRALPFLNATTAFCWFTLSIITT